MKRFSKKNKDGAGGQQGFTNYQIEERKVVGVEDMVLIGQITNEAVVENLQQRFYANEIYTYIGNVLVACNPFQWLRIYDAPWIKMYDKGVLQDLQPHIYAVAEGAFRTMLAEEEKQTIIISGESGAGKTEAAKSIMSYIAAVSGSGGNDRAVTEVKNIVLDSNPALEAFGNAMTLRNNNSSRFGKYFELKFDLSNGGTPRGGYITNYLLEKSRVVKPGPGERSFHIFYQLIRGATRETKDNLGLTQCDHFRMLGGTGVTEINNDGGRVDDAKEFKETLSSLQTIGIFPEDQFDFFTVVAICLHLSNVDFYPVNIDGAEGSEVSSEDAIASAAALLEVDAGTLAYALTYRTLTSMAPGGKVETYQVPQNVTQARATRDALAKDLYSRMFDLLVGKVNSALAACGGNTRASIRREVRNISEEDGLSIGVLDIYGFEIFEQNKFEQFCINYVNEKLQQIFIELTIKSEQEDYASENIEWVPIPYFDNKVVCELIESKKPPGVFALLDDTCKTAHALGNADDKFLEKLRQFQGNHAHYKKFRGGFTIQHYAGSVDYTGDGFVEANKDLLGQDLLQLIKTSSNNFLLGMYPEEVDIDQRRAPTTAGYKIKSQCGDLVYTLMDCNPHYVRTIKSNDQKKAGVFDAQRVMHQVRYLGLLENIKVRRAGFATRMEFHRFIARFKVLGAGYIDPKVLATGSDYDIAYAILDCAAYTVTALQTPGEAQLGRTKVFIKSPETFHEMQEMRKKLVSEQAVKVQRLWRRFANRKDLVDLRVEMNDIWEQNQKEATAADLLRPYHAFYIEDKKLNEAISNMLEYYQASEVKKEKLEYTEVLFRRNAKDWEEVVFILTDQAMYLARWQDKPDDQDPKQAKGPIDPRRRMMEKEKELNLIRRSELRDVEGLLLSQEADDLIGIQFTPQEKIKPDKSQWMDKKKVKRCMETQEPFTFFGKSKHQCHYTGSVYIKDVMTKIPLPDLGFYTPVEVHKSVVGTVSTEMREDIVLRTEKKAEIVAVLRNLVTIAKGGGNQLNKKFDKENMRKQMEAVASKPMCRALYDYKAQQDDELSIKVGDVIDLLDSSHADWWMGKLKNKTGIFPASYVERLAAPAHKPKRANPRRYMVNVVVSNMWNLRPATVSGLSNSLKMVEFVRRNDGGNDVAYDNGSSGMRVRVPIGVAGRKLKAIKQAQAERAAKREAERQRIFQMRRENAAKRDQARRQEKQKKLDAKKAKRRAERENREKEQEAHNFAAKHAVGGASFKERLAMQNQGGARKAGSGVAAKAPTWVTSRNAPAAPKPSAPKKSNKVEWLRYIDDDSGDFYWYCPSSGDSTWEEPRGNVQITVKE